MTPQRNILTSPEEPVGRFRAHPQEAGASYLLGSPAGERAACFSCRVSVRGSQAQLTGLDCAEVASATWPGPRPTQMQPPGTLRHCLELLPHPGVLFRGPFPLTANEGLELLLDIFLGSRVPTSVSWEREVPAAFLFLHGDQRAQVRSVFLQLYSQSLRLPNMYQVLF